MNPRPWRHLYKTKGWYRLRYYQLRKEPTCRYCEAQGRIEAATVVDHIKAHKGDESLFYDENNLQSLCKQHHDSAKQKEENRDIVIGGDIEGFPIDDGHHWNV